MAALLNHLAAFLHLHQSAGGKTPIKPTPVPNILTTQGKTPQKPTPVPNLAPYSPAMGRMNGTLLTGQGGKTQLGG